MPNQAVRQSWICRRGILGALLLVLMPGAHGISSGSSNVYELDHQNFMHAQQGLWLITFSTSWCGHCQRLWPTLERVGHYFHNHKPQLQIHVATVDGERNQGLAEAFHVEAYPTIIMYVDGKSAYKYEEARDFDSIVRWAESHSDDDSYVVPLDGDSMHQLDQGVWLLDFYAPWCRPCQLLAPELEKVAEHFAVERPELGVFVGKIDATRESVLARKYRVSKYPTLFIQSEGEVLEYTGAHSADAIVSHLVQETASDSAVVILSQSNYPLLGEGLWLLQFHSPFCGACKAMAEEYEAAAEYFHSQPEKAITVASIDASKHPELVEEFEVEFLPSLFMVYKGTAQQLAEGVTSFDDLVAFMEMARGNILTEEETRQSFHKESFHTEL